ncbi:MAG: SGNH/GDSL hydrolase family protein [Patescibacteria group bacterium]
MLKNPTIIFIIGACVLYVIYSVLRFWYYYEISQNLILKASGEHYEIAGGSDVRSVAVIGDSTAVGVGTKSVSETYHYQFFERHKDRFTFNVKNYGVSGARVMDFAGQLAGVSSVDLIIITITGNDVTHGTSLKSIEEDLKTALLEAHKKAKQVILLTPGDLGEVRIVPLPLRLYWGTQSPRMSEVAHRVAQDTKTPHVDIYALHVPYFRDEPKKYYASDYFHPSADGYRVWADALDDAVKIE